MSGRPVRRRLLAAIQRAGGWPAVLERIENGETVTQIARSFNVSRSFFARLLHEDRDRHEAVREARKAAADALVEEAMEIVDNANPVRDELQKAKLRADLRVWLASKFNREQYSDKQRAPVEVSIGELHLAALRAAMPPPAARVSLPAAEVEAADQPKNSNGGGG